MTKDYFLQIVLRTHHSLVLAGSSVSFDSVLLNSFLNVSSVDFHYRRHYNYKIFNGWGQKWCKKSGKWNVFMYDDWMRQKKGMKEKITHEWVLFWIINVKAHWEKLSFLSSSFFCIDIYFYMCHKNEEGMLIYLLLWFSASAAKAFTTALIVFVSWFPSASSFCAMIFGFLPILFNLLRRWMI